MNLWSLLKNARHKLSYFTLINFHLTSYSFLNFDIDKR